MEKIDLELNTDALTLGDLEDFEETVGKTIDEVVKPVPVYDEDGKRVFDEKGRPEMTVKLSTKSLVALVWIVQRQKDQSFTLADARKVRVSSLVINAAPEDPNRGNE